MKNELKHITVTMRPDQLEYLDELNGEMALRSRSATLAFVISDYMRLRTREVQMHALRGIHATVPVYNDTDSVKGSNS